ncbi:MAG TPA: ATP-binding protein [Candidatus Paceibacterota bacterium]|nr:ATP-binding protein [Candidatus Paceibacterota bacterium]
MEALLRRITVRRLIVGVILYAWCVAAATLAHTIAPGTAFVLPSSAFGIPVLFLEGVWLWPAIYLAALTNTTIAHAPLFYRLVLPIALALQSVIGAHLLRTLKIDPLFRTRRDSLWLLLILVCVAAIMPVTWSALPSGDTLTWGERYTGTLFYFLIFTPFIMRWFAKPRFVRPLGEALETVGVFAVAIALDVLIFVLGIGSFHGLSLVYLLLIPLFWIALRLRPRFVTLVIFITAALAMYGLFHAGLVPHTSAFAERLFQLQAFIVILGSIFLVIATLEEDRRLTTNLMRSQLAALENAVSRVSSQSQAKNDFIAILAHELRNPLAPIGSGIEYLQLSAQRPKEEADLLAVMGDRMQTIRRLLDDLLDISRISEGKIALRKERTDLTGVLEHAIVSTRHHFENRHQFFTTRIPKASHFVLGDPVRLEQIFTNLLTNASKYSETGDSITLSLTSRAEEAVVTVADTGIGIAPESLEDIFVPFHQIDWDVRGKRGLGIGLALVRSFVEKHDGSITVESPGPGKGSTFTVTLPLIEPPTPHTSRPTLAARMATLVPQRKESGLSVLVVDDNDAAAWGIGKLLEMRGCSVDYAYNAEQGIKYALDHRPKVILLDIGLPDMDGDKAALRLRERGYQGRIIALSGFTAKEAKARKSDGTFDAYVVKPAGLAELQAVIPEIT